MTEAHAALPIEAIRAQEKSEITRLFKLREDVRKATREAILHQQKQSKGKFEDQQKEMWHEIRNKDSLLKDIKLNEVPPNIFRGEDGEDTAQKYLNENGDTTLDHFYEELPNDCKIPAVWEALQGYDGYLTSRLALSCLKDKDLLDHYNQLWLQNEMKRNGGKILPPSYRAMEKQGTEWMTNENRTVTRFLLLGPPGHGKTEFVRLFNKISTGKDTMVITGYPYLGFDQLMASQKIINKDVQTNYGELASLYKSMSAEEVVIALAKGAETYAKSIEGFQREQVEGERQLSEDEKARIMKGWLTESAGISEANTTKILTWSQKREEDRVSARTAPDLFSSMEEIKSSFVTNLAAKAAQDLSPQAQQVEFLKGLILVADELNMNVLIDEADKMVTGATGKSFAGLEDFLTRSPGKEIKVGSITHTLRPDFAVDIAANENTIPEQAIDRAALHYYVHEGALDRVAIAAAMTADEQGKSRLSSAEQEKLGFMVTSVWNMMEWYAPAYETQDEKTTWSLRRLRELCSRLATKTRKLPETVANAVSKIVPDNMKGLLNNYQAYKPKIALEGLMTQGGFNQGAVAGESNGPLIALLSELPSPDNLVQYRASMAVQLSTTEAKQVKLEDFSDPEPPWSVTLLNPADAEPTIVYKTGSGNKEKLLETKLRLHQDLKEDSNQKREALKVVDTSTLGDIIVVQRGEHTQAIRVIGGQLDDKNWSVSPDIKSDNVQITPGGTDMLYIDDEGKAFIQPTGKYRNKETDRMEFDAKISIDTPEDSKVEEITLTKDGHHALVKYEDSHGSQKTLLIDINRSRIDGQSHNIFPTELEGHEWDLQSFEDVLLLKNNAHQQFYVIM